MIENPFKKFQEDETEDAFVDRLLSNPDQASTVYARVAMRGVAQAIFREAVRKAYGVHCAMCGLTLRSALEAAHIIPWSLATPAQRMDPRNGIWLCAVHHRLFDLGAMTVSESYKVAFPHPKSLLTVITPTDRHVTVRIAKKSLQLPKKQHLYPSMESLRHHHKVHKWG